MISQPSNEIPIGIASMSEDGTIHLQLRAETDGILGDCFLSYAPDHDEYQEIFDHLGGLKPGEYKPVPPWQSAEEISQAEDVSNSYGTGEPLADLDGT